MNLDLRTAAVVTSLVGAAVIVAWRVRETRRPVTTASLVAPPLGMSTGFLMFLFPATRVPIAWAIAAFAAGAIFFAYPLIATSTLTREGDVVTMKRSKVFLVVLLGIVAVRFALRAWVEQYVSVLQTGSLVFILAFGMLLPWRLVMYARYRALVSATRG